MKHFFDLEIAEMYGINCAVLLEHINFWVDHNRANEKNYYDGHYWTFNTIKAFQKLFPYLTSRQISTALLKLENEGLIITGNYNEFNYDRTKWYAITEKGRNILENKNDELDKENIDKNDIIIDKKTEDAKMENALCKNVKWNMQKCKIDFTKKDNGICKNVKPIPDIKPNIIPNIEPNNKLNSRVEKLDDILTVSNEVISYLNKKINASYKPNAKTTKRLIKARLNEGYSVDDFKTVIDKKYNSWYGTQMSVYLRPATLFGTKFESYLNEQVILKKDMAMDTTVKSCSFDLAEYERQLMHTPILNVGDD